MTLSNGLRVLVVPDARFKLVRVQVIYHVGANDEYLGVTGISHVVEHSLFLGTAHHSRSEYEEEFTSSAADANAETNTYYTSYYVQSTPSHLPKILELEADRMQFSSFKPDDFYKELEVVKEEQRQGSANVTNILFNHMMAATFMTSALHHPIIGWIHDLDTMTVDKAKAWYKRWYHPNNATIVINGNVDVSTAFELVKKSFGHLPSHPISRHQDFEVDSVGMRTVEVHFPLAVPSSTFLWKLPDSLSMEMRELAALQVLSGIFNHKLLTKIPSEFSDISSTVEFERLHALFYLTGTFFTDNDYQEKIKLMMRYIEALKADKPDDQEFLISEKDIFNEKNLEMNQLISSLDSLEEVSNLAGNREKMQLSRDQSLAFSREIINLKLADLKAVAKKYLIQKNLTIGLVKKGDPNVPPTE